MLIPCPLCQPHHWLFPIESWRIIVVCFSNSKYFLKCMKSLRRIFFCKNTNIYEGREGWVEKEPEISIVWSDILTSWLILYSILRWADRGNFVDINIKPADLLCWLDSHSSDHKVNLTWTADRSMEKFMVELDICPSCYSLSRGLKFL